MSAGLRWLRVEWQRVTQYCCAMRLVRRIVLGLLLAACASCAKTEDKPPSGGFDDDYMVRYGEWLRDCVNDLEATYGAPDPGSPRALQYTAVCDETWSANNPTP